jgi:hypothetical protein
MRHANSEALSFVATTVGQAVGLTVQEARATRFQKFGQKRGKGTGARGNIAAAAVTYLQNFKVRSVRPQPRLSPEVVRSKWAT